MRGCRSVRQAPSAVMARKAVRISSQRRRTTLRPSRAVNPAGPLSLASLEATPASSSSGEFAGSGVMNTGRWGQGLLVAAELRRHDESADGDDGRRHIDDERQILAGEAGLL